MLKSKPFLLILINNLFSSIGFGLQFFVLSWLAYDITGSSTAIGGVLAISALPRVILSPFIGVLIDRWDRKKTIIFVQFLRAVILAIIPVAILSGYLTLALLYTVTFIWNIVDRFYMPSMKGLIKELLTKDELLKGNTILNVIFQCGMIVGTAIAGFLFEYVGNSSAVLFNSLVFIVAAISIWSINKPKYVPHNNGELKLKDFWIDLKATTKYLSVSKIILLFGCLVAVNEFVVQIVNILLVPYVTEVLKQGPALIGTLESVFAAGSIIGGLILLKVLDLIGRSNYIWISIIALGVLFGLIPVTQNPYLIGIIIFFLGIVALQSRTLFSTTILEKVDNHYQGRVNSVINMFISLLGFFVYISIGRLGDIISTQTIMISIGIFVMLCSGLGFLINYFEAKHDVKEGEEYVSTNIK